MNLKKLVIGPLSSLEHYIGQDKVFLGFLFEPASPSWFGPYDPLMQNNQIDISQILEVASEKLTNLQAKVFLKQPTYLS